MIVGCYSMDLYCSNDARCVGEIGPYQRQVRFCGFTGETAAQCRKEARKIGWKFINGDVICPKCTAVRKTDNL